MDGFRHERLYTLDAYAADFRAASPYPRVAELDLTRLHDLAVRVDADLRSWLGLLAGLDCARPGDVARATVLVLETVFDEMLPPDACRVLAAELDLLPG